MCVCIFFFVLFWDVLYHGQLFGFVSYNQLPIDTHTLQKKNPCLESTQPRRKEILHPSQRRRVFAMRFLDRFQVRKPKRFEIMGGGASVLRRLITGGVVFNGSTYPGFHGLKNTEVWLFDPKKTHHPKTVSPQQVWLDEDPGVNDESVIRGWWWWINSRKEGLNE